MVFGLIYALTVYCIYVVVITAIGVDTLFCGFSFFICAQFQIISYELSKKKIFKNKDETVQNAIKKHTVLINLCIKLSDAYQPVIFAQFLISSLQLCVVGYQITSVLYESKFNICIVIFNNN